MDMLSLWLGGSVLFILAELVLPGQVAVGLGIAGLIVSAGLWLGLIDGWLGAIVVWFLAAPPAVLAMRAAFSRFMPGEQQVQSTDEDEVWLGRIVMVVETIEPGKEGRVAFGDTTWSAISSEGRLEPGTSVRLLMRDGLSWVVKPVADAETPPAHAAPSGEA